METEIKIGDLVAVSNTTAPAALNKYLLGFVTKMEMSKKKMNYYVEWANGNSFWYSLEEISAFRKPILAAKGTI